MSTGEEEKKRFVILDTAKTPYHVWAVCVTEPKSGCIHVLMPLYEMEGQAAIKAREMLRSSHYQKVMIQSVDIERLKTSPEEL